MVIIKKRKVTHTHSVLTCYFLLCYIVVPLLVECTRAHRSGQVNWTAESVVTLKPPCVRTHQRRARAHQYRTRAHRHRTRAHQHSTPHAHIRMADRTFFFGGNIDIAKLELNVFLMHCNEYWHLHVYFMCILICICIILHASTLNILVIWYIYIDIVRHITCILSVLIIYYNIYCEYTESIIPF